MKRLGTFALIFALLLSLCACGRKEQPKPTETRPAATTPAPTILPEIDPTLETNIPDPTVDSNSTGQDENTGESGPGSDMGGNDQNGGNGTNGSDQNSSNSNGGTNDTARSGGMRRSK